MSRFFRRDTSFRSILVVQIVAILVLTVVATVLMAQGLAKNSEDTDALGVVERRIRTSMRVFLMGANDFVATNDPGDRSASDRGLATVRASLLGLNDLLSDSSPLPGEIRSALDRAEAIVEEMWKAPPGNERILAMRRFDQSVEAVFNELDRTEAVARDEVSSALHSLVLGLFGIWMFGLVVYLGTGWLAGRRLSAAATAAEARRVAAISAAIDALQLARAGGKPAPLPAHPLTTALAGAVADIAATVAERNETITAERHRTSFSASLTDALDLADGEREAIETLRRAGRIAFPGADTQLLLADNSHSALLPALPGPCACAPSSPQSCPAARKGRALQHLPDGGLARCPRLINEVAHVACVPVTVAGRTVGALQVTGARLEQRQIELLGTVATSLGARLSIVRTLTERELQAQMDVLTGLRNRRAMNEELERLDRAGEDYTVLAADLDHFKRLNDTYGHEVGDRCLRIFAQVLRDACRSGDLPCRPGGEEFLVILPGAGLDVGAIVAERIRGMIDEVSRASGIGFTVSIGVAARPDHGSVAEDVLRVADASLYEAKEGGRNRVVSAAPKETPATLM